VDPTRSRSLNRLAMDSNLTDMSAAWPSYRSFRTVCREGLAAIRPLLPAARQKDTFGWNFSPTSAPSYQAYGRLRALYTLQGAVSLNPSRALEIAAGDGALCASLADLTQCEVAANDLRADALESCVACFRNGSSIRMLPGNLFDLNPRDTGLFDVVIASEIIEHVAQTVDFLKQLKRFLTPRGKLLITTPNGGYFHNQLPTFSEITDFTALESKQFKPDADGHLFLLTSGELREISFQAGLRVEHLELWGTPLITGHCGLRLLAPLGMTWPCYQLEAVARALPSALRSKLCFAMLAILTPV
jgi:2-polyprenyl-3-methyl-5-hydroxy-6-metoxy-1,4-benzoquinol methylase